MALKTATIFKDFTITANGTNTAVKFVRNDSKTVSVKNDNFAQQVQIYDSADTTDFFSYKYITFDNSAVFEITDCIKNEKFTTLFIQYLSNITFDTFDSNFKVDGVTCSTLQKIGLDINEFIKILGQGISTDELYLSQKDMRSLTTPYYDDFLYAIKLRFSEMPENLKGWCFTGEIKTSQTLPSVEQVTGQQANAKYISYKANQSNPTDSLTYFDFCNVDNACTAILFIPIGKNGIQFNLGAPYNSDIVFNMPIFLQTLSALITDLTISAEITILTNSSMPYINGNTTPQTILYPILKNDFYTNGTISGQLIDFYDITVTGGFTYTRYYIRAVSNFVNDNKTTSAPVFIVGSDLLPVFTNKAHGLAEAFNFIKVKLQANAANKSRLLLSFLGNTLNAERLIKNELLIKRLPQKIRIYFDYDKNDFYDIETTFEFAKSAYSNYEAYKKSNIELVNMQELQSLKLKQSQAKELQQIDLMKAGANAAQNAIFSFALGNAATAGASLISSAVGAHFENQKFNLQQQNEIANFNLKAAQSLEYARSEIVPTDELKGSASLSDVYNLTSQKFTAIKIKNVVLSTAQKEIVRQYVFENAIMSKVNSTADIVIPDYLPDTLMQFKIANRDPRNTRKGLIILGKKGS